MFLLVYYLRLKDRSIRSGTNLVACTTLAYQMPLSLQDPGLWSLTLILLVVCAIVGRMRAQAGTLMFGPALVMLHLTGIFMLCITK